MALVLATVGAGCDRVTPTTPSTPVSSTPASIPPGTRTGSTLSGFVIGPNIGYVAGATVRVIVGTGVDGLSPAEMLTDKAGAFRVDGLAIGLVSLQIAHEGYLTTNVSTVISANTTLNIMLFQEGQPVETAVVGETVISSVSANDPHCDTADPNVEVLEAPCKTFQLTPSRSGTLTADLTWSGSSIFMELLTPWLVKCCRSPVRLQFPVRASQTYSLSVGFHGTTGAGPDGVAPFNLTTSLAP